MATTGAQPESRRLQVPRTLCFVASLQFLLTTAVVVAAADRPTPNPAGGEGKRAAPETPPAGDAAGNPAKPQPAKIRLQAAGGQKVGDAPGFSLAVAVSNPNQKDPLTFIGYKADSFDPPIPKGQVSPLYKVELRRSGKWQEQPRGWCGTGLGAIALAPRATATFGVWVTNGDWDAVRLGVTWTTVAFEKAGEKPGDFRTEWSNELTHNEVQQVK